MKRKPNILFILTDDQRYGTINAIGNDEIITPSLDELSKDSLYFDNAYIQGGYSGAVCMPSRCMLLTGRHVPSLENLGATVPESQTLIGEVLKENGYDAFGCGKWHNSPAAFTRCFTSGKNAFFGGMWDHWNVPVCDYDRNGNYDNVIRFTANFSKNHKTIDINCDRFNPGVHSTDLVADSTIEYLESVDSDKPFFCYTAFLAPHDPRTMPDKYRRMYDDRSVTLPPSFMSEYPVSYTGKGMRDEELTPYPRTQKESLEELKDYYAMITHVDDRIGDIISTLKRRGLYDDTIIVFTADNGLGLGCHGFMGKQNLYEPSIHVPLMVHVPSALKGRSEAKVYIHDLYPTLLELADIEVPASVESSSFKDAFFLQDFKGRDELYYIMIECARAVRKGDYKLSYYYNPATGESSSVMYNIKKDPYELCNIAVYEKEKKKELMERLVSLRDYYHDTNEELARIFWSNINLDI